LKRIGSGEGALPCDVAADEERLDLRGALVGEFCSRASSETRQSVSVMSAFCTIRSATLPVILDAA